jgi:hypothetical protein
VSSIPAKARTPVHQHPEDEFPFGGEDVGDIVTNMVKVPMTFCWLKWMAKGL